MSKIVLGIPVIDQHELTCHTLNALADATASPKDLEVVVFDNNSAQPYPLDFNQGGTRWPFKVRVARFAQNLGYYQPLAYLSSFDAEVIALIHNDLYVYTKGWDKKLLDAFRNDPELGVVGFCGSDEIDDRGGRGGGTMCHFRGERGQSQAAGQRIGGLHPALILDSLFMAFRPQAIPSLGEISNHTPLCHFVDKLWPLRATLAGWRVAVLGIEVDHVGGQTAVGIAEYEESAKRWCLQEGLAGEPGGMTLYLEAERRFLDEARAARMLPSKMDGWTPVPTP